MSINRTPSDYKTESTEGRIRYNGFYQGIIKSNTDVHKEGRLKVFIPELGGDPNDKTGWITIFYSSPFAGASDISNNVDGSKDLNETQTSYGWLSIPPDINNHVLVGFVMGDPSRGFLISCLYQNYMNHMVPGIPLNISTNDSVNAKNLPPVAEYNKKDPTGAAKDVLNPQRPVYTPLHDGLTAQGLYPDPERGASTTGARRQSPPNVYGFLSPNGNTYHIDDDPENGFIRLRTRGGVQVLIHETTGYVYLNSKEGNSWIEISDEGIDMYSKKSISLRAEENINLYANQNIIAHSAGAIHTRANNITQYSTGRIKTVAEGEIYTTSPRIYDNSTDAQAQADAHPAAPNPTVAAPTPPVPPGSSLATSAPKPAAQKSSRMGGAMLLSSAPIVGTHGNPATWQLPVRYGQVNDIPGTPRDNGTRIHTGYDIGSYVGGSEGRVSIAGAPVSPSCDGVVTMVVSGIDGDGGGRRIVIQHEDGTSTRYLHLASVDPNLFVGQTVTTDMTIGNVGGSGATGDANYVPHLHYERLDSSGNVTAPFGDSILSEKMTQGFSSMMASARFGGAAPATKFSFDNRANQVPSSSNYGSNTIAPTAPTAPSTATPTTAKNGSGKGNTDTTSENQILANSKNPPSPVAASDVVGNAGNYKATSTKTIVTRMPTHEPWTGHPQAVKADRTGYTSKSSSASAAENKTQAGVANDGNGNGGGIATNPSGANASSGTGASVGQTANTSIPSEGQALLDTIAGPTTKYGDNGYNTLSGGTTFQDYSQFPPQAQSQNTTAGRYQMDYATWQGQQQLLGLPDFSPSSQDSAAWNLSQTTYYNATGGDLTSALRGADQTTLAQAGNALRSQWASLPGGVMQTANGATSAFATRFSANLANTQKIPELGNYGLANFSDLAPASSTVTGSSVPSGVYVPK